jgi:hypothetical protein
VLSSRVSRSSSGDGRVPLLRTLPVVSIWQNDKRTDDYKINSINCVRKLIKNKREKEAGEA